MLRSVQRLTGNDIELNASRFVNNASHALDENQLGSFLPADTRKVLQGLFDNKGPLTYAKKEELVKILNARMRGTTDGNTRAALQTVRNALDDEANQTLDEIGSKYFSKPNPTLSSSTELATTGQLAPIQNSPMEQFLGVNDAKKSIGRCCKCMGTSSPSCSR